MKRSFDGKLWWEQSELEEYDGFLNDPETYLLDEGFLNMQTRKELWVEWFQELKYLPKEQRKRWKDHLMDLYAEVVDEHITVCV